MKRLLFLFVGAFVFGMASLPAEVEDLEAEDVEESPSPTPAPTASPASPAEALNKLGEAQIDQAIGLLQKNYLLPSSLSDRELKRAQLAGLLDRLGPGAEIAVQTITPAESDEEPTGVPFLAEVIDGRIGYLRPTGINTSDLAQTDALLQEWSEKEIPSLILDLRSLSYSADFELAADFARRFTPKGRVLFRLDRPSAKQERIFTANQEPLFTGLVVVLTNAQTAGAAEILAGILRSSAGAMVLGDTTAGKPVEYSEFPLGADTVLRVAVAEAILANNERAFPTGFLPDLRIEISPEEHAALMKIASERGVGELIFEQERPRMNEAALISNANPELQPTSPEPARTGVSKDHVLQRAVDVVTALQFYKPVTP